MVDDRNSDVPVDDDADRWRDEEWRDFELWEKIDQRNRRRRRMWILSAVLVFVLINAVPVVRDSWNRWKAGRIARAVASEIQGLRRRAVLGRTPMKLRFTGNALEFITEKVPYCGDRVEGTEIARASIPKGEGYSLVAPSSGAGMNVPGLVNEYCYDPLLGTVLSSDGLSAFAVAADSDLEAEKLDRFAFVLFSDEEISIGF